MLLEISTAEELDDVLDTNSDVVLCFTAPSWCVPCQRLEPHYTMVAETTPEVVFVKIDIDKAVPELAQAVQSVPTVAYFHDGEVEAHLFQRTALKLQEEIYHHLNAFK